MGFYCNVCEDYLGDKWNPDTMGEAEEWHMVFKHGYMRNHRNIFNSPSGTTFEGAKAGTSRWQDAWTKVTNGR